MIVRSLLIVATPYQVAHLWRPHICDMTHPYVWLTDSTVYRDEWTSDDACIRDINTLHTHTHTHMPIYMCMYVSVSISVRGHAYEHIHMRLHIRVRVHIKCTDKSIKFTWMRRNKFKSCVWRIVSRIRVIWNVYMNVHVTHSLEHIWVTWTMSRNLYMKLSYEHISMSWNIDIHSYVWHETCKWILMWTFHMNVYGYHETLMGWLWLVGSLKS